MWYYAPDNNRYFYFDYDSIKAGDYTVTATDDVTRCYSKASIIVPENRVTPEFTIVSTPSYCADSGQPIGTLTLTPTVNDDFKEIAWTSPDPDPITHITDPNLVIALGPVVLDLYPRNYHVHVTTVEGCTNDGDTKVETEVRPYNLVSPTSQNANNVFTVDCISLFPQNNVKIFNRNGTLVYETTGYATDPDKFFRGVGEQGVYLADKELPEGTYFYIIDKKNGTKPKAGFLELVR
jgi:hypothetical protein